MEKEKIFSRRDFIKTGLGFVTLTGLTSCALDTKQPTQELEPTATPFPTTEPSPTTEVLPTTITPLLIEQPTQISIPELIQEPTSKPEPTAAPTETPTSAKPEKEVPVEKIGEFIELRNCTTNAPEALEKGVRWAIDTALEKKGGSFELPVNIELEVPESEKTLLVTKNLKIIVEVYPLLHKAPPLQFARSANFGYYKEGERLLIGLQGNAPALLYSALLGLQLPEEHQKLSSPDPYIYQIPLGEWDKINRQPLIDIWKSSGIDNMLLSPDSMPLGGW